MRLEEYRELFRTPSLAGRELIHLNNAGMIPVPKPVRELVIHELERISREGVHVWDDWVGKIESARKSVATLLGAKPTELGFFSSTAHAVSQLAFGIGLGKGDEVLTWDQEYPSNLSPWREACARSGATLRVVPSTERMETPVERLLDAITPRTRAVALSWIQYQTGAVTDFKRLTAITRPRGIWTVMDTIQGMGLFPFDFSRSGLDAVCGGSHKWMTSTVGTAYLALREDRIPEIAPAAYGAYTYQESGALKKDASRFEPGSKPVLEILALGRSAELLQSVGIATIQKESERLANYLASQLRRAGYMIDSPHGVDAPIRGAIVNAVPTASTGFQDPDAAVQALQGAGISCIRRHRGVRLSPHPLNTEANLERAVEILRTC